MRMPFSLFPRAAAIMLLALLIAAPLAGTRAEAQTVSGSNDVNYGTILDYSANDVLLSQGGFAATTTYDCVVATRACQQAQASTTSLLPAALSSLATTSSYKASPDYAYALVSTYVPGGSPIVTLNKVSGSSLSVVATLPALKGLVTGVRWSPDDGVLIISESGGTTQKYVVATKTLTALKTAVPPASWITVSPDGRYVAYYLPNTLSNETRTFGVVDTVADKSFTLAEPQSYWDLLSEGVREFAFSPDSTKLLYLDDRSGRQTLYEVDLAKLSKTTTAAAIKTAMQGTQITSKPYDIADMQWLTNSSIIFSANRNGPLEWGFFTLNLNTYAVAQVTDYAAYTYPMIKVGGKIVLQTADALGRQTRVYDPVAKTLLPLLVPGAEAAVTPSTNQAVKAGSLSGVYMPAAATSTLLVWLHGGPDRQTSLGYHSYQSYGGYDWVLGKLQASGVPVLKLDYPGSTGYGLAFAESVKGGVGTVDAQAAQAAISAFAKEHGYTNVYLMGNSYGGYLALKLLVTYPSQYKGVLSLSGVTDWPTLVQTIPSSIFALDFNGPPSTDNGALYGVSSIINHLNELTDQKVYIVQGDADTEVPYSQSTLLDSAIKTAGKQDDYTTLPGEDHVYENPASYTLVCNKALNLVGLASSTSCAMR
jgi:dipeptidyl aminopeptidase/acylaminoacyl peptidase